MYNFHLEKIFFDKLVLRGGKIEKENVKTRIQKLSKCKRKWPPCFNRATFFQSAVFTLDSCFAFSTEIKVTFTPAELNIFSASDLGLFTRTGGLCLSEHYQLNHIVYLCNLHQLVLFRTIFSLLLLSVFLRQLKWCNSPLLFR